MTLPLIRLLERTDRDSRDEILALLSGSNGDSPRALSQWLDQSDAIEYSRQRAAEYAQEAVEALAGLESNDSLEILKRSA